MDKFYSRDFPRLVGLVYEAALDPARWQQFLDELTRHFGGASGALYGFDHDTNTTNFHFNYGTDPSFHSSYLEHYQFINPYRAASGAAETGKVVMSSEAVPVEMVESSAFFNEWMRPQKIPSDHFGIVLSKGDGVHVTFGLAPETTYLASSHAEFRDRLALLTPHMMRALQINRATEKARFAESAALRISDVALEAVDGAAFVLTENGRLVRANRIALEMLEDRSVFTLSRDGQLRVDITAEAGRFAAAVARAGRPDPARPAAVLKFTSRTDGKEFLGWLVPFATDGGMADLRLALGNGATALAKLVLVVRPTRQNASISAEIVQRSLDLTGAQARLVSALVSGRTLAEYADATGLSRNTIRNHLSSVFQRTGTRRQSELVSLVIDRLQGQAR